MYKTKSHKKIYVDPWVTFWKDGVELPSKKNSFFGYIEFKDGAHAVVFDKDNNIVLFKQYRYPIKKMVWSIPGGKIEIGETPENAVKREIKEEIGVDTVSIKKLGKIWHFCGAFNFEKSYLFLARTKNIASNCGEENETINSAHVFSPKKVLQMIDAGEIEEIYVSNALQMAIRTLHKL